MASNSRPKRSGTAGGSKFLIKQAKDVRIVCVDFDQTLVTTHTQGRWKKTASELATFTRPVIVDIIMSSLDCKIPVAIVTSSMQVNLIRAVLLEVFGGKGKKIKVKGMDDSWASPLYQNTPDNWKPVMQWKMKPQNKKKIGKTDHFLSLAYEDFEKRKPKPTFDPSEILYVDDDHKCISAARTNGLLAFQISTPSQKHQNNLNQELLDFFVRKKPLPAIKISNSSACSIM